jgi:hypothetical protein
MPARITLAKKAAEAVVKQAPKATSSIGETIRNTAQWADDAVNAIAQSRRRRSSNQEGPILDATERRAAQREGSRATQTIDRDGVVRTKVKRKRD